MAQDDKKNDERAEESRRLGRLTDPQADDAGDAETQDTAADPPAGDNENPPNPGATTQGPV